MAQFLGGSIAPLHALLRGLHDGGELQLGDVAGGRAAATYARITGQPLPRGDLMRWLGETEVSQYPPLEMALARVDELIAGLQAAPELAVELEGCHLSRRETEVQATCYTAGARYVRHVDNNDDTEGRQRADGRRSGRRITCIIYANPDWSPGGRIRGPHAGGRAERLLPGCLAGDGGELRLYPDGGETFDVQPLANRLVVFWSDA